MLKKVRLLILAFGWALSLQSSEVALYSIDDSSVMEGTVSCADPVPDWAGKAFLDGGHLVTNDFGLAYRVDSPDGRLLFPLPAAVRIRLRVFARGEAVGATLLDSAFAPQGGPIPLVLEGESVWSATQVDCSNASWLALVPTVGSLDVAAVSIAVEAMAAESVQGMVPLQFVGQRKLQQAPAGLSPGLVGAYFVFPEKMLPLEELPDLSCFLPTCVRVESNVCFASSAERWPWLPTTLPADNFALRLTGFLQVSAEGSYTFSLRSDDGSTLALDDSVVIENDGAHSVREKSATVRLTAGLHPIEVCYFDAEGLAELSLLWSAPGLPRTTIPPDAFFHEADALSRPRVCIAAPAENAVIWSDAEFRLAAAAESPSGIASVEFVADGTRIGAGTWEPDAGQWVFAWADAPIGERSVVAVAMGMDGLVSTSSVRRIRRVAVPPGYAQGVRFDVYRLPKSVTTFPRLDDLTPCQTDYVESLEQPLTKSAWVGLPTDLVDNFAAVFTGCLWVTEPGEYEFALDSDDGARLTIDGEVVVEDVVPHAFHSRIGTATLGIGMHDFRVEFYENSGEAGLSLSWGRKGQPREPVGAPHLLYRTGTVDRDGDGLEDWWETMFGLNPDNPADALNDLDGDGLTNLDEFRQGTDPTKIDTDGDGVPDGWEVRWGLNPIRDDALEDPDGDGLSNLDEFRASSNPHAADTDGDGLTDYEEFRELGTSPTEVDRIRRGAAVAAVVQCPTLSFSVATADVFSVEANIVHIWRDEGKRKTQPSLADRLVLFVDGRFIAHRDVPVNLTEATRVVFYTPVLGAGAHTISISHGNPDFRLRTSVEAISLAPVIGLNYQTVVRRRTAIGRLPTTSRVSPAFIEGTARFPWCVSATRGNLGICGDEAWYLDLPLTPTGPAEADIVFEGTVSTNVAVAWEPTELFGEPITLTVRAGSSLLLSGSPEGGTAGRVDVFTNGIRACGYEAGEFAVLALASDEQTLSAVWHAADAGELARTSAVSTVSVVSGRFPEQAPACVVGETRAWVCPQLPETCSVVSDRRTRVERLSDSVLALTVLDTRGDRIVTARLEAGGPVLDSVRLVPVWAVAAYGNVAYAIETNEFGTVCRSHLMQAGADATVNFRIRSYTTSVLLDDLSLTRTVGISDFDADGRYVYDLIKPDSIASPCHLIRIYQGEVEIGEAVYGNGELPAELKELEELEEIR